MARCDPLCLAGSDCKPCLRELADRSASALEYHSPKRFLPSLIAEDDTLFTSMAEEKASVLSFQYHHAGQQLGLAN